MNAKIHVSIALGALLVGLVGCGGPTDKIVVSGEVTFNGKPIDDGVIRFRPVDGTEGPVTGAMIVNGMYKVKNKGGVTTGTNRVEIEGYRPTQGGKKMPEMPGMDPNPRDQYVPKKFNTESELRITIESGRGRVAKNFDLAGVRP